MARPSRYSAAIAERILAELRRGRALREVCGDAGMPSPRTVHQWVNDDQEGFAANYRQARETGRAELGRAPACTPLNAERILRELSTGRTLVDVCRDDGMPAYATVRDWVRDDRHGFAARYREAIKAGGARWARPTRYAADIAEDVLDGLCDGRTLEAVCGDPGMPTPAAVRRWVEQDRDGFAERYRRSRWFGCAMLCDQIISIADARDDWIHRRRPDGVTELILDPDRIRRRRLQVDARYQRLSRLLRYMDGDPLAAPKPGDTG